MTKKTKILSLFLSLCLIFSALIFPQTSTALEIIDGGTTQPIKILTPDEVPFALDFQAMRQAGHVDRLATQETLLNEVLFANDDGSLTSYYFGVPVKYIDSDGAIKDKDNTIVQRNDMKYTTAANDVKAVLPQNISEGVTLEYNDYTVRCVPYVNSDVSVMSGESLTAASASAVLNTANPKANKVQYNSVFNNKSSIVYTPTFMGVKEDIILTEYTGNVFKFRLETDGLVPQTQENGSVLLNNAQGETVFEISPIVLVDANGEVCLNNNVTVTQLSGNAYLYTITANEEFLTDESTAYPVAVDPTFGYSYYSEDGIDSYTLCLGENSGYYQSEYLPVGITTDMYGSEVDEYRSFIELSFMTSSFFSTNYPYATIDSVYLNIYSASAGSGTVSAHMVAPSSYTGTVLDDFARYVSTPIQSFSTTIANGVVSIDVTDEALLWKNGTATWNYPEIMLKSTGMHNFYSVYYYPEFAPYVRVNFHNTVADIDIDASSKVIELYDIGSTHAIEYTLTPATHLANDTVNWTSSDTSVATVSVNGVVTAVGSGRCTITATTAVGSYVDTAIVDVILIEEGTYFIKNAATEKYMDVEGPSMASGANIQQWSLHAGNQARWTFTRLDNGYYTIKSVYSNCYVGVSTVSTNQGFRIQQFATSNPTNNMQWHVYITERGNYTFKPRSNLNMAMAVDSSSSANGADLYQKVYTNDDDVRDEWILGSFDLKIINYYDLSFADNSELLNNIPLACNFVDVVFQRLFGVTFTMQGEASYYSTISTNQCECDENSPCTTLDCGTYCYNHHKNLYNISDQLYYGLDIKEGERYVLWTNRGAYAYCCGTGEHIVLDQNVIGAVYLHRPVIHFLGIRGDYIQQRLACMAIGLLHELTHTFGMDDVYDENVHELHVDSYTCMMGKFNQELAYDFYTNVLYNQVNSGQGGHPFCDDCLQTLRGLVLQRIGEGY